MVLSYYTVVRDGQTFCTAVTGMVSPEGQYRKVVPESSGLSSDLGSELYLSLTGSSLRLLSLFSVPFSKAINCQCMLRYRGSRSSLHWHPYSLGSIFQ